MSEQTRITVEPPRLTPIVRGQCDTGRPRCSKPARLYPAGWRCPDHQPPRPDLKTATDQ